MPPRHLFDVDDLTDAEIEAIFTEAEALRNGKPPRLIPGHVLGVLFQEPSVRSQFGFMAAMARLGGAAIEIPAPYQQPAMSGRETLADLTRSVASYAHLLAVRCDSLASWQEIAANSPVPVINAGTGTIAHPTQALIDAFAIRTRFGRVDGLRIGLMGDLASSRSAKSLLRLLSRYKPAEVRLIHPGPAPLAIPLASASPPPAWHDIGPDPQLSDLDVIYMAGFPAGRGTEAADTARSEMRRQLSLNVDRTARLQGNGLILCPLPRIDEITAELDNYPTLGMFRQSADGIYVRMAVLSAFLPPLSNTAKE